MARFRTRHLAIATTAAAAVAVPLALVTPATSAPLEPTPADQRSTLTYHVTELEGGPGSANSINNVNWIGGTTAGDDGSTQATVWRGDEFTLLGTLGGPNSAILWPNKNNAGLLAGVAETSEPDLRDEDWSCGAFFAKASDRVCAGFVWEDGEMRALPTHGGTHGFATGVNNRGQVVGWAETMHEDDTCNPDTNQELGFLAAIWDTRDGDRIRKLKPLAGTGDTATAATAINDWGQAVGISGICDQAVGRLSARTAVLWQPGRARPVEIGNFGSPGWNTPMAINNVGVVVGFANQAAADPMDPDLVPFRWTKRDGFEHLGLLEGDTNGQAVGVNIWGQIAGVSQSASGSTAVVWHRGAVTDLNSLTTGYDGHLRAANDINDLGVITGQAVNADGEAVVFRATPTWSFSLSSPSVPTS